MDKISTAVGRFCSPVSLIIPLYLLVATGGFQSLSGVWIPAVLAGAVFAAMQLSVSTFIGPQLRDILAALSAMSALVICLRIRGEQASKPLNLDPGPAGKRKQQLGSRMLRTGLGVSDTMREQKVSAITEHSGSQVLSAWLPYGLLVACVLLWGVAPIQRVLNKGTISF